MILTHSHRATSIDGHPLTLDSIFKGMLISYHHGAGETSYLSCTHVDKQCAKFSGFRSSVFMELSEPLDHKEYELLKEALVALSDKTQKSSHEHVVMLNKGFRLGYVDYMTPNTPVLTSRQPVFKA